MAFNAKNLTYESKEPAFLRRLKNEYGGGNSDRHERPSARPRKQKHSEDDEDEPTYVDEDSNDTLTKAEYEAILKEEQVMSEEQHSESLELHNDSKITHDAAVNIANETSTRKELVAAIGGTGKRRVAKVIGDDDLDQNGQELVPETKAGKRSSKKPKKIKLSFNDEGTESH
ncbi:hypothetical protein MMC11_005972 [Xylographa trunciseda]|nr:hypothetical protein [Xylographa trunciseda]